MSYKTILVETHEDKVGIIRLNRPEALNALCAELADEMTQALRKFDSDPKIGAMVITGNEKAFAAGADIKEIAEKTFIDTYKEEFVAMWEEPTRCRKPVIAVVQGYALGGGCELALMCDFIIAAESAKFGQPEISIGTLPGAGGSQRLARTIGKAKTMDMCLTGRMIGAEEAESWGIASRVFANESVWEESLKIASQIADCSTTTAMMVKEAINTAFETTLSQGVHFERRLFHASFSTADQKEGMAAFVEKRKAEFKDN